MVLLEDDAGQRFQWKTVNGRSGPAWLLRYTVSAWITRHQVVGEAHSVARRGVSWVVTKG
jgi:hypothetical protein